MDGYFISGSQCLLCHPTCLTCNGAEPTACLTCISSKYFLSSNSSCVDCNLNGYYVSGSQCLQCDSTCKSCDDGTATSCVGCYEGIYLLATNNSCTTCKDILRYYSNDVDQTCHPKPTVQVLKFELQESPQLYLLNFDTDLDLENSLAEIKLYQISDSANNTLSTCRR